MGLWAAPPAIDGISAAIDGTEPDGQTGGNTAVFQDIAVPGDSPAGCKVVDFDNMPLDSARLGSVPSISGNSGRVDRLVVINPCPKNTTVPLFCGQNPLRHQCW